MHLLPEDVRSLDGTETAQDLGQSPADLVVLSFSDSDLSAVAAAWTAAAAAHPGLPTLRLANLARLRHPYSVDLYLETVGAKARAIVVRCLGGADYWRYGVDELAALARARGIALAVVPGDHVEDLRLDRASTLPEPDLRRLWTMFQEGGPDNMAALVGWLAERIGRAGPGWSEPQPVPPAGRFEAGCRSPQTDAGRGGTALVLFYRSMLLAADTAPVEALADALAVRGLAVVSLFVTSLKDPRAAAVIAAEIEALAPDVIVNTTAFSGRLDQGGTVLDRADAPVLQAILPTTAREAWAASTRGLGAADLAMNVVLPELDGRIVTRALSFKAAGTPTPALEFVAMRHRPEPDGIAFTADLAAAWARLRRTSAPERRLAMVLSDYPAKGGRTGYAVGLDTAASVRTIAAALEGAGYAVGALPDDVIAALEGRAPGAAAAVLPAEDYARLFADLPESFRAAVTAAWGPPGDDPDAAAGAYRFPVLDAGRLVVAVQPDRGRAVDRKAGSEVADRKAGSEVADRKAGSEVADRKAGSEVVDRKAGYHDPNTPPRHAYIAFHLWLRHRFGLDVLVHLGTHGTLEWLPGKAVALAPDCAPAVLVGPVPVVYPFIVNDPGEAAPAKRRIGAVTVGHLTPPLTVGGVHGAAAEIEAMLEEYGQAQGLDPRRARLLADAILDRARATGLAAECGLDAETGPGPAAARGPAPAPGPAPARGPAAEADRAAALARLDAFLCDLKELRIGDGLHVFGRAPEGAALAATAESLAEATGADPADLAARIVACAAAETAGLLAALDGRFVPPGPAGAPARGRTDVLPTGRNLTALDPRAVPTETACEIGARTAAEVMARHAQDHGEWPRRIVIDLWGSATLRTGGDDLGQAFALLGVRPVRDAGSARVSGFAILPAAKLDRPRVDVTLRVSGLFRDMFPAQIALFDEAARAVAALDEDDETNPLAADRRARAAASGAAATGGHAPGDPTATAPDAEAPRIFGTAPGAYGVGLGAMIREGGFADRDAIGAAYLAASGYAYGAGLDGVAAEDAFRARVATADAFVHVQDDGHRDLLDADDYAAHEGGFAAAAAALGARPALYHADTTRPGRATVRTLAEALARTVRGRAANPRWIAGQMRHGHRGAAEIAETVASLAAFAATTDAVVSGQFDLVFDATLGDERVRAFLFEANPHAARATARTFRDAHRRGWWTTRRNAPLALLAELTGDAA